MLLIHRRVTHGTRRLLCDGRIPYQRAQTLDLSRYFLDLFKWRHDAALDESNDSIDPLWVAHAFPQWLTSQPIRAPPSPTANNHAMKKSVCFHTGIEM
jgi:hypothetical protein